MNQEILQTKTELVNEVVASIKDSSTVVICEYRGLTVAELTDLRKTLRTTDSSMAIYKNTLVKRAVESLGLHDAVQYLEGPNALIFCKDVTAGAKVLAKYSRKNDLLVIKAGIVEGKVVDKKQMLELSKLPNKEGMISMLLSVLQAPVRQFACAVKAVADSKN